MKTSKQISSNATLLWRRIYIPKQKNIDFEPARDILMKED